MIYIYYKKKEWRDWVCYSCHTKEEAEKMKAALKAEGYEIRSY